MITDNSTVSNLVTDNSTILLTASKPTLIFTSLGFITFGTLGLISSTITVMVIALSKPIHTPCYIMIAGGGIGSFTVAAHYLIRGINKIRLELGTLGYGRTALECLFLDGIFGIWGIAFHSIISCAVAIDRLVSVTFPVWYRGLGIRYAFGILAGCALFTTVEEILAFVTAPLYTELTCTEFNQAISPVFFKIYTILNLFFCALNVAVYVAMVICFYMKQKSLRDSSKGDRFLKQQLAVIPTIKLMAILYSVTGILAEVFITARSALPTGEPAFILIGIGSVLKDASSLVEGISLLVRSRKFRNCFRLLLGLKSNSVISVAINQASQRM